MIYITHYDSPIGRISLAGRKDAFMGLWIEGQKYFLGSLKEEVTERNEEPVFGSVKSWLDRYFAGERPQTDELDLSPEGSAFRKTVWKILCEIPYGELTTYGKIARELTDAYGFEKMSAQAVGGAVAHNPISIIIPCHRVVGTGGSLTGYAGGIEKKIWLLKHEKADMSGLFVPKKGTAL